MAANWAILNYRHSSCQGVERKAGEALFLTTALSVTIVAPIYSNEWNSSQGDEAELLSANN